MIDQALELYRKACGMNAPLVLECEGPSQSQATAFRRSFECPFVLIGRDPKADLALDGAAVSRRHVFLQAIAGRLLVIDLQSRTKVYWEGKEDPELRGWLDFGQSIRVGAYRIRRIDGDAAENPSGALPALMAPQDHDRPAARPLPRAALELPIRTNEGPSLWPIEGEFALVGGSDDCQLVLTDESVSRQHAAIVLTSLGVCVVDLLTREGVYVNGERVRWAWLADGDRLRIGRFTFVLRYETPPDHITRRDMPLEVGAMPTENPGTELVISGPHSHNARNTLVKDPTNRSPMALNAARSAPSSEPQAFVPSERQGWESSMAFPMNPMAMWQQQMQMMEMFHNDMIMMVQMFAAMHRQQLESVRHEMDMVQRLTGQLQDLQTKLAEPSNRSDVGPVAGSVRPTETRAQVPAPKPKNGEKKSASRDPDNGGTRPESATARRTADPQRERPKTRTTQEAATPDPLGGSNSDDSQMLAHVTRRISELQRERQGYWQRILSVLHN